MVVVVTPVVRVVHMNMIMCVRVCMRVIVVMIVAMDMIVAVIEGAEVGVAALDPLLEDASVARAAAVLCGDLFDRTGQDHIALAVEQQHVGGELGDDREVVADEHDGDLAHVA